MKKVVKNTLCALTAAAMLCASAPLAFAEEITAEPAEEITEASAQESAPSTEVTEAQEDAALKEAIAIAKTKLDIPEEYSEFSSDSSAQFGIQCYDLMWKVPETNNRITVSVSSKGDILEWDKYHDYSYKNDSMSIPKISEDAAKSAALEWLTNVNPSWISQLNVDETKVYSYSLRSSTYNVSFKRYVNGVPFGDDFANLGVDKNDGTITEFSSNWSYPSEVADISGAIPQSEAQSKLIENSPFELSYRQAGNDKKAILVYTLKKPYIYINALDGTLVDRAEEYRNSLSGGGVAAYAPAAEAAEDSAANYKYTEEELTEIAEKEKLLTADRAMEIFRGIKHIEAEKYTLARHRYSTYKNSETGKKTYSIYLSLTSVEGSGEDAEISYMNVTLDAESGELKSLYSYSYDKYEDEDDSKYDVESGKAIANEFVSEYAPNEYIKTRLDEESLPSFSYYQWENDIIFRRNSINIEVDKSGIVKYFSKNWDNDVEFESPEGIISAATAAEKLFEQNPPSLFYEDFASYNSVSYNFVPVYQFGSKSNTVSAKTGKLLNYDNTEYTEKDKGTVSYENLTDIKGHYSEEAVKTLLYFEIISLGEDETTFRPDEIITQTELLSFVEALSGYSYNPLESDSVYRIARNRSIITSEEIDREARATRCDAAKFIVRAIGFDEVAALDGIFNCGFSDRAEIPAGLEGYIAIAKGLKIVKGDEVNCFNPNDFITRGDAAIMIYNYLTR